MVLEPITCPYCGITNVTRHGKTGNGKPRDRCQASGGEKNTFIREYSDKGRLPEIKQRIITMALNGSGVRDTARTLGISTTTVLKALKKESAIERKHPALRTRILLPGGRAHMGANSGPNIHIGFYRT